MEKTPSIPHENSQFKVNTWPYPHLDVYINSKEDHYKAGYSIGARFWINIYNALTKSKKFHWIKNIDNKRPELLDKAFKISKDYLPLYIDEILGISEAFLAACNRNLNTEKMNRENKDLVNKNLLSTEDEFIPSKRDVILLNFMHIYHGIDVANVDGINVDGINVNGINVDGINVDGINVDGINVDGINVNGQNINNNLKYKGKNRNNDNKNRNYNRDHNNDSKNRNYNRDHNNNEDCSTLYLKWAGKAKSANDLKNLDINMRNSSKKRDSDSKAECIILAHNEDHDFHLASNSYFLTYHIKKNSNDSTDVTFFSHSYPGCIPGFSYGFNSNGLVISCNFLPDPVKDIGISRTLIGRYILESDSIDTAIERIGRFKPRSGGVSYNIVSAIDFRAVNIEVTGDDYSITDVFNDELKDEISDELSNCLCYFRTNHYISKKFTTPPGRNDSKLNNYIPPPDPAKTTSIKRLNAGLKELEKLQNGNLQNIHSDIHNDIHNDIQNDIHSGMVDFQWIKERALNIMHNPDIFVDPNTWGGRSVTCSTALFMIYKESAGERIAEESNEQNVQKFTKENGSAAALNNIELEVYPPATVYNKDILKNLIIRRSLKSFDKG